MCLNHWKSANSRLDTCRPSKSALETCIFGHMQAVKISSRNLYFMLSMRISGPKTELLCENGDVFAECLRRPKTAKNKCKNMANEGIVVWVGNHSYVYLNGWVTKLWFSENNIWTRDIINRLTSCHSCTGFVIMAPRKRTKVCDLVESRIVFVKGKIMSKSGPKSLDIQELSFSFQLLVAANVFSSFW